jgi:hypothetical protein
LLIANARQEGEETADVASRFGVSPATVRRLEAQLTGVTSSEVSALRSGSLSLAVQAVIARHVAPDERAAVVESLSRSRVRANELERLFTALGWRSLVDLGTEHRNRRLQLLDWALKTLAELPRGDPRERMRQLATRLPIRLESRKHATARGSA